jgi:hypothetical protein
VEDILRAWTAHGGGGSAPSGTSSSS